MFSQRVPAGGGDPNRLTRLLDAVKSRGDKVLELTISNPTRSGIAYPEAEILSTLTDPTCLRYQPRPLGSRGARSAVARYYGERGCSVDDRDVVITASTSEAYSFLFKLLTDPGQSILVPRPSYPLLGQLAALEGVQCRPYPLLEHDAWRPDLSLLQDLASLRSCPVVTFVNPNNPTGTLLRRSDFLALSDLACEADLSLIYDEVFFDYSLSDRGGVDVTETTQALTFVLNGLSKTAALPQMKLSWIVLRGPEALKKEARRRMETIADAFLSVSSPVQLALPRLLELRHGLQDQIRTRLQSNLAFLTRSCASTAVSISEVEAGWYANLTLPRTRSDEEWALLLLDRQRTLVHPGYFFDFPREAVLVVSLLTPEDEFREGVGRICQASGE